MIAIESFKKFRNIDLIAILILSFISCLFDRLIFLIPNLQWAFILSVLTTTILMTFTVFLIRKVGSVTIFYLIRALLTYRSEGLGLNIFFILITAGIIFELIFLVFKVEFKNIPLDIVSSAAISNLSIPIMMGLLLSTTAIKDMLYSFVNLILVYFIIGIAGALVSFFIWHKLKLTKIVMQFEYMQ